MPRVVWLPLLVVVLLVASLGSAEQKQERSKFHPTTPDVVAKMLDVAKVTKDDLVYDLGCGDGRIVVAAAKKYGCRAAGFDIDPDRVEEASENVRKAGVETLVTIQRQDVLRLDLQPASVVTIFLVPDLIRRLTPQLEMLKPGSRIVSHEFEIEAFEPDQKIEYVSKDDKSEHLIYLYTVPLKKRAAR